MKCEDIRENLSAYREGTVPPEDRELIEQHLASCPACSTVLRELERAGDAVKRINEVEPPPWMKQRIMARVREEAEHKRGLLRWLFYPLHIKVPLQALGTVLIAVLAVYVFKAVEPQMKGQVPLSEQPVLRKQEAPYPYRAPAAEPPAQEKKAVPRAESKEAKKKDLEGKEREAPAAEESSKDVSAPPPAYSPAPPKKEALKSEGAGPTAPGIAESRRAKEPSPARPPAASLAKKKENLFDAQELKNRQPEARSAVGAAKTKTDFMGVKIYAKDVRSAGAETINLLKELGAGNLARESRETGEIITAEVGAEKVKELAERLKSIGEVEEKDARLDSAEKDAHVRIVILPAP
jgi:hypothetical protein